MPTRDVAVVLYYIVLYL